MVALVKPVRLRRWIGGINNVADLTDLEPSDPRLPKFLRDAVNIDLDDKGKPTRRAGAQLVAPGVWHSAWSDDGISCAYAVGESVLYHFDAQMTQTPLATVGLQPVSYAYLNGEVYWSNGQDSGVASLNGAVREWGLSDAPGPTASATGSGGLAAGAYRVAMTYRTATGEESGATESVDVTVAEGGGIQVVVGNLPEDVAQATFYRSDTNGAKLFQVATKGVGTHVLGVATLGRPLDTQFMERIPAGRIVRAYRGRLYVALQAPLDDTLVYTRPLRYGLFKPIEDYIRLGAPISFVEPVDGGLYVGTRDRTVFLAGDDPTKSELQEVDLAGAVPYASTRCRASVYADGGVGTIAVWWNRQGRMAVGSGTGQVTFPTQDQYASTNFDSGSIALRERDGARHIISLMRGAGQSSGFAARDVADAEVIRNGIVVPPPTVQRGILLDRVRVAATADTA